MMVVANPTDHLKKVCDELCSLHIDVEYIADAYSAKAGLALHSPAFILLDYNGEGANLLLHDIAMRFFRPCPYTIVSALFHNGTGRAAMLRLGADACIDSSINIDEVLAVINVIGLLESYKKRSKQIELLHYELSHPARVSANEMIGAMSMNRGDGNGHSNGHISDKTLYIALNYQSKTESANSDTMAEIVERLTKLEMEQNKLTHSISLLDQREAQVIRLFYFKTCHGKISQRK